MHTLYVHSHLTVTWDQMYGNEPTAGLSPTSDPSLILGGAYYTVLYVLYCNIAQPSLMHPVHLFNPYNCCLTLMNAPCTLI